MDEKTNFIKTFEQLKKFAALPISNDRDKAGIIQAFEITFEQCWKCLQKKAGKEGVNVASPQKAFSYALQSELIEPQDESHWLKMIDDRNSTSHTYKEDIAREILDHIMTKYIPLFEGLLSKLK